MKVVAGVVVAAALLAGCAGEALSDEEEEERDLEFGAQDVCETFVERRLKAPASAEFGDPVVERGQGNRWRVSGTVDSENSFGALLRNDYLCVVEPADAEGENWKLIRIQGLEN